MGDDEPSDSNNAGDRLPQIDSHNSHPKPALAISKLESLEVDDGRTPQFNNDHTQDRTQDHTAVDLMNDDVSGIND